MIQHWRWEAVLFFGALLLFSWGIGTMTLWDIDEPNNAQALKEMLFHLDPIVPTFNGNLRPDKPILNYWLMAVGVSLFGLNEFGLRIGSVFMGALLVLFMAIMGRLLFDARTGFYAGTITATILHSQVIFRAAVPDAPFIFFIVTGLLLWIYGYENQKQRGRAYLFAYAAFALAVLAKGPIGALLPGFILLAFLVARFDLPHLFHEGMLMAGAAVFSIIVMPWYLLVGIETEWAWLQGFFGTHNFGRFVQTMEGHGAPFYIYPLIAFVALLPWAVLLPIALYRERTFWQKPLPLFFFVWAVAWIGFFSMSATKLPNYIWPAYPPLIFLIAIWLREFTVSPKTKLTAMTVSFIMLGLVGMVLAGTGWLAPMLMELDIPRATMLGIPFFIGAVIAIAMLIQGIRKGLVYVFAFSGALLSILLVNYVSFLEPYKPAKEFGQVIAEQSHGKTMLMSYGWFQPSFLFYAGQGDQQVLLLASPEKIHQAMVEHHQIPAFVVTPRSKLNEVLENSLMRPTKLLHAGYDMYTKQEVVLFRADPADLDASEEDKPPKPVCQDPTGCLEEL